MYNTNIVQVIYSNKVLTSGIKLYELLKLAVKYSGYRNHNSKEYLPYIIKTVSKGYTVLDMGTHQRSYLFDMLKIAKLPGRLVVIETGDGLGNYFKKMKKLLHLDRIIISQLSVLKEKVQIPAITPINKNVNTGATIISFSEKGSKNNGPVLKNTIDYYCAANFTIPALIKIKIDRNDLAVLEGARETMSRYKPQIILETAERMVSRDTLESAFTLLSELHYSGYFILDTIKVPLASFDFNIYQNEVLGFYCNHFFFE